MSTKPTTTAKPVATAKPAPKAAKPAPKAAINGESEAKIAQVRGAFPKVSKEQAALYLAENHHNVKETCNALADSDGFRWKTAPSKPARKPEAAANAARPATAPGARAPIKRDDKKPIAANNRAAPGERPERREFTKKVDAKPVKAMDKAPALPTDKKDDDKGTVTIKTTGWSAAHVDKGMSFADRVRAKPTPVVVEAPKPAATPKKTKEAPVAEKAAAATAVAATDDKKKEKRERKTKKEDEQPVTPAPTRSAAAANATPLDPAMQSPASMPAAPPPTPAVAPVPHAKAVKPHQERRQASNAAARYNGLTKAVTLPEHVMRAIRDTQRELLFNSTSPPEPAPVQMAHAPATEALGDKWTTYNKPPQQQQQFVPQQPSRPLGPGYAPAGASWSASNNNANWNAKPAAGRQAYMGGQPHYGGGAPLGGPRGPPGPPYGAGAGSFGYGAVSNNAPSAGTNPAVDSQLRFAQGGQHGAGLW
jgi:hypothetical protein